MSMDRRSLLKGLAAAATVSAVSPAVVEAKQRPVRADARGLLYDATKCVGCKACVVGCKSESGLKPDPKSFGDGLYDASEGLTEYTKTIVQLYREGDEYSFVKKQCMHCVDPGCVSACMLGALSKGEFGIVSWQADRCVGCRYCQVACPFEVPQFEWSKANPRIVKCDLCQDRVKDGKEPVCAEICPRGAIQYGTREELLKEAHARIAAQPDVYVNRVYGETELGGTQVLYLSGVEFEKLGFRFDQTAAVPAIQQSAQRQVYAPLALLALVGGLTFRQRRKDAQRNDEAEKK
jgi:formate dehydrogenase iron-sulfur subunit